MGRDHPVLCRDNAAPADGLMERVLRLERIVEQIGCVLLPQNMKDIVEGVQHVPLERVQNSVVEHIVGASTPHTWEPIVEGVQVIPQERVPYRTLEQIEGVLVPYITEDGFPVVPQEREQNRFPEQIMDSLCLSSWRQQNHTKEQIADTPVPQIMEAVVEVLPSTPQERVQIRTSELTMIFPVPQIVQNRFPEQIMDSRVPQIMEAVVEVLPSTPQERVLNRTQEQIADTPVPQIMEAVGEVVLTSPQECVHNRAPELIVGFPVPQIVQESVQNRTLEQVRVHSRIQEQIVDLPVPQTMSVLRPKTGKVFTVEMPHQHVHQAYPGDYVVFNIKGLDKHNMPRSGDVMVPAFQIQEQIVDVGGSGIVRNEP